MAESQRPLWHAWATTARLLTENPYSPLAYFPGANKMAAYVEVMEGLTRSRTHPDFGIDTVIAHNKSTQVRISTTGCEHDHASQSPFCELLHFEREGSSHDPKVLIVAPMSGHYATLLRETVKVMLQDHDVHITDWRNARDVPLSKGTFTLNDYIHCVPWALHKMGGNTHVVAVCQPGPAVVAATSLMAEDKDPFTPCTLTLMGSPIDARQSPTKVNELAQKYPLEWFENNVIEVVDDRHQGVGRRVYPGHLQLTSFMSMNADRHANAQLDLYKALVNGDKEKAKRIRDFYNEYMAVMDLPAEFYLDTIKKVFQEFHLAKGEFLHRDRQGQDRPVVPSAITQTAILTIEGEKDDICGLGQTKAALELLSSVPSQHRQHHHQEGAGHYGLFSGSRWEGEIYPQLRTFIAAHHKASAVLQ